jgi:hypothetical protein
MPSFTVTDNPPLPPEQEFFDELDKRIKQLERDVKPEQELQVTCRTATGVMRVQNLEFFSQMIAVIGADENNQAVTLLVNFESLQVTCTLVNTVIPQSGRAPIAVTKPTQAKA